MIVNNNYFRTTVKGNEEYINIPLEITFDMEGRGDMLREWEEGVIKDILNPINDFEVTKFAHKDYNLNNTLKTEINYEFNFFDYLTPPFNASVSNWAIDYENASFTDSEIYYFANSFKNSFFKLDFYDTNQTENQTILLSIIIPTQQGLKEPGTIGPPLNQTSVEVKKPKFVLDYTGADKEGFYVYWLKDKNYLSTTEFYVSAKFFNAKKGQFVRMVNTPQSNIVGLGKFNVNKPEMFYYKYELNYDTYDYQVYTFSDAIGNIMRVGSPTDPIKWYEYVNP
jgi:hypothetical protein